MPTAEGHCEEQFRGVRDAFERNFDEHGEVGAAVAVVVDGRPVVDLWGGLANPLTASPWRADTLTLVMSTTKALTAVCVLRLWERGELDIDAPVAEVWPEFAAAGKEGVTIRHLMTHQAGLPTFDQPVSVEECHDHDAVAALLARQAPRWRPGTDHGYHAFTYGWLLGEVVRRVTGRTVGRYLAEEVCTPLGMETYLGLPPQLEHRVCALQPMNFDQVAGSPLSDKIMAIGASLLDCTSLTFQTLTNPALHDVVELNSPALHQAEWPAIGGITTARSMARLYGELACDRVLSAATLDAAGTTQVDGPDRVLVIRTAFGLGFQLPSELCIFAPAGGGFGHDGAGGSVAFADRRAGLGFAYVMNQMSVSLGYDARAGELIRAAYAALDHDG